MPGRVFISCGQATDEERKLASEIATVFSSRGFHPYVAIQTQSIQDVNGGIIGNLRAADYYVFVDLRRDALPDGPDGAPRYRGSLFSHQELAIAYALGLDNALFLRQKGVLLEGMAKYILSNAPDFETLAQVPEMIKEQVNARNWSPQYSRHLVVLGLRPPKDTTFMGGVPHGMPHKLRCWVLDIENRRSDRAAVNARSRLLRVVHRDGTEDAPDRSDLKWAGQPGFSRTIRPEDFETIDVLALDCDNPRNFYLLSAVDAPKVPVIAQANGQYTLCYDVHSDGFPPLEFALRINATGDLSTTTVTIA